MYKVDDISECKGIVKKYAAESSLEIIDKLYEKWVLAVLSAEFNTTEGKHYGKVLGCVLDPFKIVLLYQIDLKVVFFYYALILLVPTLSTVCHLKFF